MNIASQRIFYAYPRTALVGLGLVLIGGWAAWAIYFPHSGYDEGYGSIDYAFRPEGDWMLVLYLLPSTLFLLVVIADVLVRAAKVIQLHRKSAARTEVGGAMKSFLITLVLALFAGGWGHNLMMKEAIWQHNRNVPCEVVRCEGLLNEDETAFVQSYLYLTSRHWWNELESE